MSNDGKFYFAKQHVCASEHAFKSLPVIGRFQVSGGVAQLVRAAES